MLCFADFDPRRQDTPEFIQQPEDNYYLVKNFPVEIECKALYATKIKFTCAGVQQEHEITQEYYDSNLFKKVLVASLEVTKDEVKAYYGGSEYRCHCTAFNTPPGSTNGKSIDSKTGLTQVACK